MNANWSTCKLKDIADVRVSNVDKKTSNAETPVKLCNYMDVYSNDYVTNSIDFMAASASKSEIERFLLQAGDVIITKDSETPDDIGVPAVVIDSIDGLICGYHLALIRPRSDAIDPIYLAKQISTAPIARYFSLNASGSTRFGLPISVIEDTRIPVAPKLEQTKIAEILFTVDRAIEQTEASIAKQQRIKTGLMQDLLTRGIDKHGNLRSEQTHQFKDSPLGRIPGEWEVKEIQELLADVNPPMRSGPFGSALLKEELSESGIPLLGIDNVLPEKFVPYFKRFVTPKKALQLKRFRVRPHDVMITIMGTVGRSCMVPSDIGEALSSKHVWTISFDEKAYSPYLACIQINYSPWVLNHFAKDMQGGIMTSIRSETLRSTPLPVPPLEEMREIGARLRAISANLRAKQVFLRKLASLKTALMQDLLTGRRCVHSGTIKPPVVQQRPWHDRRQGMKKGCWTLEEQKKEMGSAMAIATTANLLLGLSTNKIGKKYKKMMLEQVGMDKELFEGGIGFILIPMMPFAVEVCLKVIKAQGGNEFIWTHNLKALWEDLNQKEREEIRKGVEEPKWRRKEMKQRVVLGITEEMRKTDEIIEDHQDDFVEWRYVVDGEKNLPEETKTRKVIEAIMDLYRIVYACVEYHKERTQAKMMQEAKE